LNDGRNGENLGSQGEALGAYFAPAAAETDLLAFVVQQLIFEFERFHRLAPSLAPR
jgi:hypothetical protein